MFSELIACAWLCRLKLKMSRNPAWCGSYESTTRAKQVRGSKAWFGSAFIETEASLFGSDYSAAKR